ncbi:MAG TPA: hypothetical protein VMZ53_28215 [Kofleriaceae bacterium]|nr:hypothetical protein [Kofleriaceae bacterium]
MTIYARLGLLAVALAPACDWGGQYCEGDWAAMSPEQEPATPQARVVAQILPTQTNAVDILFVIDDSKSMTDEQEQLGIWSNELFDVLGSSGELPDLHIAVTSSSVAIPGLTQCDSRGGQFHVGKASLQEGDFIRDGVGPNGRVRNYTGALTDTFAKMARVGDGGCGFEQPFKAARLALSTPGKFLRADALLLVVFVTDEDDCSATDGGLLFTEPYSDACSDLGTLTSYRCFEHGVRCYDGKGSRAFGDRENCHPDETSAYVESVAKFADYLKALKRNPAQVVVAGIYGKPNHVSTVPDEKITSYTQPRLANVCGTGGFEGTGATPAIRMNALLAKFGGRASQSSICDSELSWAMRDVGLVTRDAATRSRCLRGALLDIDAATAGVQPACRVVVARDVGTRLDKQTELPPCTGSQTTRCYTIDKEAACAATDTRLAVRVDDQAVDETLTVSCDVDLDAAPLHPSVGELRTDE